MSTKAGAAAFLGVYIDNHFTLYSTYRPPMHIVIKIYIFNKQG